MLVPHLLLRLMVGGPRNEPILVEDRFGNDVFIAPATAESISRKAPRPTDTSRALLPRCLDGMVYVPGGTFNKKRLSAFCLDAYEVTIGAVEAYLKSLDKSPEVTKSQVAALRGRLLKVDWPGLDDAQTDERSAHCTWNQRGKAPRFPANCISYDEAEAYCTALGRRLPSERERQWAARGGRKAWPYPWGTGRPSAERLNMAQVGQEPRLVQVGSYEASPGGLYELSGNVGEWIANDPAATTSKARGGSFRSIGEKSVKVTAVMSAPNRQARSDEIGFRCAAAARTTERAR